MGRYVITTEELDALRGLPRLARDVYIMALRLYMDFATGIVGGPQRRISWRSLAEDTYVEPHQGISDSGLASEKQLRRAVEWLERSGLVTRNHEANRSAKTLIFRLPLAASDYSASNKVGSKWADLQGSQVDSAAASDNKGSQGEVDRQAAGSILPQVGIHPVSVYQQQQRAGARMMSI